MHLQLAHFQCLSCEGPLVVRPGCVACATCGDNHALIDDRIIDFVGGRHGTTLRPDTYVAAQGINIHQAERDLDTIRRVAGRRWPASFGSVLEIGCGTSAFSSALLMREDVHDLVLTDVSVPMLRACRARLDRFRLSSLVPLALATYSTAERCFADARFDTCLGTQVLHHILDVPAFLAELFRILKPSGIAFFVEPALRLQQAMAKAFADIIARLLTEQTGPERDRQLLHNWIAEVRRGALHQGDLAFLSRVEDKHLFVADDFARSAMAAGFASAEALATTPDPDGTTTANGLLAALGISPAFAGRIVPWLPQHIAPDMAQLAAHDPSQSYLLWLCKPAEAKTSPASPTMAASLLLASDPPIEPTAAAAAPPAARWHVNLALQAAADGLCVTVNGWCLFPTDLRWLRLSINGVARDMPVWAPRADVHLAFNRSGAYGNWNALCCGVRDELRFPLAAGSDGSLTLAAQAVLMNGDVVELQTPRPITAGETIDLGR